MTPIVPLVRAWLLDHEPVAALVDDAVAPVGDPSATAPFIIIGPVSGGPRSDAGAGVMAIEDWTVALYCYAPRRASGLDDSPDTAGAWQLAQAVAGAAAAVTMSPFQTLYGRIVAARIVTAAPGLDSDLQMARATVTVALTVVG